MEAIEILKSNEMLKEKILEEIRANVVDNQLNADEVFKPFIENYYKSIQLQTERAFFNLGLDILELDEIKNDPTIDKTQLYLAMSLLSIYGSDEMSAVVFWKLAQKEKGNVGINKLYSSIMNPVADMYNNNSLISLLKSKFSFINDYETVLERLTGVNKGHFLLCGIKHVRISKLLHTYGNDTYIVKIYAQELINSLCTLNESLLKKTPMAKAGKDIGECLKNISAQCPNIATYTSGLFKEGSFLISHDAYHAFINKLEKDITNPDELKANSLYALNKLRNEALHRV